MQCSFSVQIVFYHVHRTVCIMQCVLFVVVADKCVHFVHCVFYQVLLVHLGTQCLFLDVVADKLCALCALCI